MPDFLGRERLAFGPWSAFERAIVRLFLHKGYPQVEYTGGPGDRGCDVIVLTPEPELEKLIIQCKFTGGGKPAGTSGVSDLERACIAWDANRGLLCINARSLSPAASELMGKLDSLGFDLEVWRHRELLTESNQLPMYSKHRKKPREEYQSKAIEDGLHSLRNNGRALIEMATGLGKTIVMAEVMERLLKAEPELRILVLAHSKAIVAQLERAIWSQLPKTVMTHILSGSEKPIDDEGVTVATFQSLISDYENDVEIPDFDLIMVDECHHAQADSFSNILNFVSRDAMMMGVTATPWRGDQRDITEIFGDPIYQMGIIEGISLGWLADIEYEMYCDNVDWKEVRRLSVQGHSIKSLNSKLFLPARDEEMVTSTINRWEELGRPKVITFCQSKKHAEEICNVFNSMGLESRYLHGDHDEKTRAEAFTGFRIGEFYNLIGVDILNEGVDLPDVELVVFARITHSRRIFVQQLGRGLRVTDTKDSVTVLDFVADIRRLGALAKLNREARDVEFYRDSGADLIEFDEIVKTYFVEEYLADVANLEDHESPKLDFIHPSVSD